MRVILFDIDGTLILTGRAGQFAMTRVVESGRSRPIQQPEHSFAGRTDRAIISDYFRLHALEEGPLQFSDFCRRFLDELPEQLRIRSGQVLPGVRATLERLSSDPNVTLGLLTGNLREAAKIKLEHFELGRYFEREGRLMGGFGDDFHDRDDVARAALDDVRSTTGLPVNGHDVWVVGDTPLDVRCGKAISARVVALATGGYSKEQLATAGADLVLANLDESQAWWELLS